MTKLEKAIVNNFYNWMATPKERKIRYKLTTMWGLFLRKLWEKEHNVTKAEAEVQVAKLILSVVFDEIGEEENNA